MALADQSGTWAADLANEIGGLDEVLLAAFLHDAGKGLAAPGSMENHSDIGARLATDLLRRTGFGEASTTLVASAVRHHLLLPDAALRRDIDDPVVVQDVAGPVGEAGLLRILALLSVADARATGPDMWSPWRETLIRSLFLKVADHLEGTGSSLSIELEREVAALSGDLTQSAISDHLALMPAGYVTRFDPATIAAHVRLASDLGKRRSDQTR